MSSLGLLGTFLPLLRFKAVPAPLTFKCPLVPYVPCLGILLNVGFIVALPIDAILRLLVWTILGFSIYFLYGIRNSSLYKREQEGDENEALDVVELEETVL